MYPRALESLLQVNRFAVGTCQHFVTNRDINRGEQLTISYFEHEYCRKVCGF